MGVLVRSVPRGAVCVFTHRNDAGERIQVPATVTGVHEFVNHSDKYLCDEHANLVANVMKAWGFQK